MDRIPTGILLKAFLSTLLVAIFSIVAHAEPFETVINNGDPLNRVDIAVLGDGYTASELAQYRIDVQSFMQGLFGQEPYREYQRFYNVHRIDVTSNQSGADHSDRVPPVFVDTALDAAYNCQGIQRLICVNTTKVNQVISRTLSSSYYDVILVIVNDAEYGGSGGAVAVASIHPSAVELILHEVGHSFGLLADEYAGGGPSCNPNFEPSEPNATRQTVRELIKWNNWISPSTPIPTTTTAPGVPGLYVGARYCETGLYRPTYNSKMRSLGLPFEQINTEQHVKRIYNFVSPIDASSPAGTTVLLNTNQSQVFSITTPQPFTHTLNINWLVDGHVMAAGPSFTLIGSTLSSGAHTVRAAVSDTTPFVRIDPEQLLSGERDWTVNVQVVASHKPFDYDADGRSDISVFRPSTGAWFLQQSTAGLYGAEFGYGTDKITPADYDGDGKTEIAVYRPETGIWYIFNSSNGTVTYHVFGIAEDRPTPADYDGDGRADISVFRPSTATWYRRNSSDGSFYAIQFGTSEDKPTVGDFDGDGHADVAIFRPSVGAWYQLNSSNNQVTGEQFGFGTDVITPADFDGDSKTDLAVFRPSNGFWYVKNSNGPVYTAFPFGLSDDIPAAGDFDGDGKADLSVFRPSDGTWYRMNSSDGSFFAYPFGTVGDKPTQTAFTY